MTRKNLMGWMLALGLVSAAAVSPLASQVPGIPGPPSLGITVGVKATTLGLGLEVGKSILPRLSARVGVNGVNASRGFTWSGIPYDVGLKFMSFAAIVDLKVLGPLRLSGGLVVNKNELSVSADPTLAVPIGSTTYQVTDIGTITGAIGWTKSAAPYLGIGLVAGGRIAFIIEAGAMFSGPVALTSYAATTPLTGAAATAFQTEVANERTQVQSVLDGLSWLDKWPVVGFGLQVKF